MIVSIKGIRGRKAMFRLGPYAFSRSIYDRTRLVPYLERWEGDDLKPMTSVVIVEVETHDDRPTEVETFTVGDATVLVIDWDLAREDPAIAAELRLLVERAYKATGYVEGDRFVTILDRLDDLIRVDLDPADRSGMDD